MRREAERAPVALERKKERFRRMDRKRGDGQMEM